MKENDISKKYTELKNKIYDNYLKRWILFSYFTYYIV